MLIGYNISNMPVLKFVIMGLGYVMILFIRDPFKVYMQDIALKNADKNSHSNKYFDDFINNRNICKYIFV